MPAIRTGAWWASLRQSARPGAAETGGALRRLDLFLFAALAVHLALALSIRVTVWPEVTTPGYLWSRGLLMYRDIKLQHAPGTTGSLALLFLFFGPQTWLVRAYATLWPLLAHFFVLRETRRFPLALRALTSAFFLALFFSQDGNAVWPTVVMAAMALPVAAALSEGRMRRAGLWIGAAILFKQTAAYLLLLAVFALLFRRRTREAATLFAFGCVPYLATLAVFTAFGAGVDMLRWTILVPFTVRSEVLDVFRPGSETVVALLLAFMPLAAEAALEKPGEHRISARWLLVVAAGLALICYPRFQVLQTVGSVPCLAVGAARLMRRRPAILARAAVALVSVMAVSRAAVVAAGNEFDGKHLFWNEDPALELVVAKLHGLPRDTPVYSELWGNVLPRADKIPPGRIYQHPWFDWFFEVDRTGERMRAANAGDGVVIVGYRGSLAGGEPIGPYAILHRPGATRIAASVTRP